MAESQVVQARVSNDLAQQVKMLAIQRGLFLPDGKANLSAAVRLALEVGLTSLRLESRRADPSLPARTRDVRQPRAPTKMRIEEA